MNVSVTPDADMGIWTLDPDSRVKAWSWIGRLSNWETDETLRGMTKPTVERGTYALNTTDDLRIFFALDEAKGEIVVVDLSRPSRFKFIGAVSE